MPPTVRLTLPLLVLAATACTDGPKAPPLTDEAVFRDDTIGLRFLVPAEWAVKSRGVVPPGRLGRTVVVVSYQRPAGRRPATFDVLAIDRSTDDDLGRAAAEHGPGSGEWVAQSPARRVIVNGSDATQIVLVPVHGKDDGRREVTAFHRGDRVYLFILTYSAADPDVRDAVRSTVESITWTK